MARMRARRPALIPGPGPATFQATNSGYAEGWLDLARTPGLLFFPTERPDVIEILLAETDRLDWALKQFRRRMLRSGRFKEMKRKRFFSKPSVARKEKEAAARRRKHKDRKRAARREGF